MKSLSLFLISFAAGPAIFWVLARQRPSSSYFTALFVVSILLPAGAFLMQFILGKSPTTGVALVILLWLGWVMVLSLCFLAIRTRATNPTTTKLAFALCAMATTLPWFGLYTASMMGS